LLYDDSLYFNLVQSVEQLKALSKVLLEQVQEDGIKVDASIF